MFFHSARIEISPQYCQHPAAPSSSLLISFGEMKQKLPPKNFDWLQGEIQRRFESLSPHLRRIAEYALADPNRFALQTVAKSARESGVQPSTLVRFAKLFGYAGYTDMQQVFRLRLTEVADSFRHQVSEHRDALEMLNASEPATVLNALSDASVLAVNQLKYDLQAADLRQAVQMLEQARSIHVLGQRQAFPVAACLSIGLLKLGCRCHLLDTAAGMLPHQIASLTPEDLLVVVGLADFSRTVLATVPEAREREVPVLSISNSQTNPLARNSSLNLLVRDPKLHHFEPLAPYVVLAQTLVIALARARKAKGEAKAAGGA